MTNQSDKEDRPVLIPVPKRVLGQPLVLESALLSGTLLIAIGSGKTAEMQRQEKLRRMLFKMWWTLPRNI
jgi:hypothetical protein